MPTEDLPPIPSGAAAAVVGLLDANCLMAIGVNGTDGWPQVTTVSYINDGLTLYFITPRFSRKIESIQADPRVSVAIRSEPARGDAVGVTMAARASEISDPAAIAHLIRLMIARYPDVELYVPGQKSDAVIRLQPEVISAVSVIGGLGRIRTYGFPPPPPLKPVPDDRVSRLF